MQNRNITRRQFARIFLGIGGTTILVGSGISIHKKLVHENTISVRWYLNPAFHAQFYPDGKILLFTHLPDKRKIGYEFIGLGARLIDLIIKEESLDQKIPLLADENNITQSECKKQTNHWLNKYSKEGLIYKNSKTVYCREVSIAG